MSNPYAAPATPVEAVSAARFLRPDPDRLAAARRSLASHLANSAARADDLAQIGSRFGIPSIVFSVLTVVSTLLAVAMSPMWFIGTGVGAILALVFVIRDFMLGPREGDREPAVAFKNHLRAAQWGKDGYVFASTTPLGRGESAKVPDFAPVPVGDGVSAMGSKELIKGYFRSFLRPGSGQYRWATIKKAEVVEQDGDVAYVRAQVTVNAVPQAAYTGAIVAFVLVRLLGLIALAVVMTVFKKTSKVQLTKTMIRGEDGLWYALQASWEGEVEHS